jgi:hypothetical protein
VTPETQRELIAIDDDRRVECVDLLLRDPDLLPELQVRIAQELSSKWNWALLGRLVEREDLTRETQLLLARHGWAEVRGNFAINGKLLREAEAILAMDESVNVEQKLIMNRRGLSVENQVRLTQHPHRVVRMALASNYSEKIDPAALAELVCDRDPDVRLKAVENNTIPAFSPLAFRVASDRSPRVRRAAVEAGRLTQQRGTVATELPGRLQTPPVKRSPEKATGVEEPETGEVNSL